MEKTDLDIIYNDKYLFIVPQMSEKYYASIEYTFKNVIFMKNSIDEIKIVSDFINSNNFEQLVFVDYQVEYERIITNLNKKHTIKYLFTNSLGNFSNSFIYGIYKNIYDNYKKGKVESIGFLDYGLYMTLKNKGDKVNYIKFDIPPENPSQESASNLIGCINCEDNNTHSFYNELSAIKLTNKYVAHIPKASIVTKGFIKTFDISVQEEKNASDVIKNNLVNLCVNFTDNDYTTFLKSMDLEIPCILGNSDILDNNSYLKEQLVINSDDDVNEIKDKILSAIKNKDKIISEYHIFREKYRKEVKELAEDFVNTTIPTEEEKQDNDTLISVVVPVYNTSAYLEKCIDSIMAAIPEKTEVLIINDGSKDNSEEIILKYVEKYPNTIRYIKQSNHGLGNVRNVGLKEAKGKYIASIDSDDTININFFNDIIAYLEKDIDLVICDWLTITDESKYETAALDWVFRNINKYEGLLYTSIMPSTCNKIIKKSLFADLKYKEDKYEDLSTNPLILLKAKTIKYLNKPYYEYYIRSNSIMRSSAGLSMIDVIKFIDERLGKYKEYINVDIDDFKYYTYSWRIEEYVMNQLYTIDEKELESYIKYIDENIKEIVLKIINNKKYINVLDTLKETDRKYLQARNKAIAEGKLLKFIRNARKKEEYFKLTPPIIYYGYNE